MLRVSSTNYVPSNVAITGGTISGLASPLAVGSGGTGAVAYNAYNPASVSITGGSIAGLSSLALTSGNSVLGIALGRAAAAQSLATQTVLQNATGISFPIAANEEWVCQVNCDIGAALSTTGLQVAANAPAGATIDFDVNMSDIAVTLGNVLSGTTAVVGGAITLAAATLAGITTAGVICDLWILNGANAGTVQFQFAQATSSATNLTLRRGSYIVGWRIA
jgi:hypothetical protein